MKKIVNIQDYRDAAETPEGEKIVLPEVIWKPLQILPNHT